MVALLERATHRRREPVLSPSPQWADAENAGEERHSMGINAPWLATVALVGSLPWSHVDVRGTKPLQPRPR